MTTPSVLQSTPNNPKENEPPIMKQQQPSSHVVNKVNAILFQSDQGPASNLLLTSPPPPTDEIQFPRLPDTISPYRDNTPGPAQRSHHPSPQRSIHFDQTSMATSYVLDEEIVQLRHTAAIVAGLQKKLKMAKQELSDERANRKRKEKNLIKLAKEMNSRNQENVKNDKRVEEMEETIRDLEERLAVCRSQELPRLQLLCEQKERALSELQSTSERHWAELEDAKQEAAVARQELMQVVVAAKNATMQSRNMVKDEEGATILAETQETPSAVAAVVQPMVTTTKTNPVTTETSFVTTLLQQVLFYSIIMLILSIGFLRSDWVHPSVMNSVCAPLPPGSYYIIEQQTASSPYWAPEAYRRELFSLLCPGRGHTVLKQHNSMLWNKQSLEVLRDGVRVWKGRAGGGFYVHDDKIVMMGRRRRRRNNQQEQINHELKGPWTLG